MSYVARCTITVTEFWLLTIHIMKHQMGIKIYGSSDVM